MERRTILIAVLVAVLTVILLTSKLSGGSKDTREGIRNTESRVTMRPFYSLNGYNPMIRASRPEGAYARIRRMVSGSAKSEEGIPRFVHTRFGGVEVAYRAHPRPRGVVMLLHGCGESAGTWYELPEHHAISAALYEQRFSSIAITSANRETQCWSGHFPAGENEDVGRVLVALRQYYKRFKHGDDFPLHGLGVSSGGSFLSVFSTTGRVTSQALYITPGNRKAFRHSRRGYPRTLFVHAQNDALATPHAVHTSKEVLLQHGVNVGVFPQPMPRRTADVYSRHIDGIPRTHSSKLAAALDDTAFRTVLSGLPRVLHPAAEQVRRVLTGAHAVSSVGAQDIAAWL